MNRKLYDMYANSSYFSKIRTFRGGRPQDDASGHFLEQLEPQGRS